MMSKFFYLGFFVCLMPVAVRAQSMCASLPDCEQMGYHLGYEAACGTDNSRYITCPYDTNYRKCVNYDCAKLGFTTTDKSSWCKTVVTCKFNASFTLCAETKEF